MLILSGVARFATGAARWRWLALATIVAAAGTSAIAQAADGIRIQAGSDTAKLTLKTRDAAQQLLATGIAADGMEHDLTHKVAWTTEPAGIVSVDKTGRVTPLADGTATIKAAAPDGSVGSFQVAVVQASQSRPINFANQIVPVFTKNGCNGGGCHGKSAGQNGFKLSLLGFEPGEDYEHLVKEARGRRLFPAAPERSLLLQKGAATLPHGGGKRLEPDSDDYRLLVRWISQGMPTGSDKDPTVTRITVYPTERTLALNGEQQLVVTAHYTDGSTEDVTRSALFEANDKDMARPDERGLVKVFNQPGEVAIMVRYQARVAVFRATVPLGARVDQLPIAKNYIDEHIFRKLKKVGIPPSDVCDDVTFIRRVTLDIAGRLPTPAEVEAFLGDKDAKKRDAVVDRLVNSGEYAEYFANKWSALLRNKRSDPKHARGTYAFHDWIRDSLYRNKPFDQFAREILTASGEITENPPVAWYRQVKTTQAQLEDTAQLFLGLRLQCAQCHHHPYEKWSQHDYWSFAAFYSQVGTKAGAQPGEETVFHRRGIATAKNKKNNQDVKPAGLGTTPYSLGADEDPRLVLADWLTAPDNKMFARCLVNRYWKHFFNRGLVDPEDDMRETNPATNPELLDALADHFIRSGYDLKALVRSIAQSTTYQLSAIPNAHNAKDRHHFSRFYPRRLPAEVLFDSVNTMLQSESRFEGLPPGTRAVCLPDNSFNANNYFLTVFGRPESSSACECERSMDASLSQSLHLLNSKDIQDRLASDAGRAAKLALDTQRKDEAKLRELYRLAYSRDPQPEELKVALEYLAKKNSAVKEGKDAKETDAARAKARREAYEDTLWALLNTKEFLFNH